MKTYASRKIRPTKLQPQIFSVLREMKHQSDYRVIVDRDDEVMAVLLSPSLLSMNNIDIQQLSNNNDESLLEEVKKYYSTLSKDEKEIADFAIDDGIE